MKYFHFSVDCPEENKLEILFSPQLRIYVQNLFTDLSKLRLCNVFIIILLEAEQLRRDAGPSSLGTIPSTLGMQNASKQGGAHPPSTAAITAVHRYFAQNTPLQSLQQQNPVGMDPSLSSRATTPPEVSRESLYITPTNVNGRKPFNASFSNSDSRLNLVGTPSSFESHHHRQRTEPLHAYSSAPMTNGNTSSRTRISLPDTLGM